MQQKYQYMPMIERIIQFYLMQKAQLQTILSSIRIDLDPQLLQATVDFINKLSIPKQSPQSTRLHIIAASAIRSEVNRVKAVGAEMLVKTGPSAQIFLRYMRAHQKQPFLALLMKIAHQWDQATEQLRTKVREIERTYNIYLKFRNVFNTLSEKAQLDKDVVGSLISIFWIAYLKIKKLYITQDQSDKQGVQKQLLLSLFYYFFKRNGQIIQDQINKAFKEVFQYPINSAQQKKIEYQNHYQTILQNAYKVRYGETALIDWKLQMVSPYKLLRFADDLNIYHSRQSDPYKDHQINQLSYLQMNKSISPLGRRRQMTKNLFAPLIIDPTIEEQCELAPPIINRKLFQDSDQEYSDSQDENNQPPKSPIKIGERSARNIIIYDKEYQMLKPIILQAQEELKEDKKRRKKFVIDNTQTRIAILKWIQDQIKNVQNLTSQQLKDISPKCEYQTKSIQAIINILELVCVSCSDKIQRARSIYKLFLSFLHKMKESIALQEFISITSSNQYLDSFLCATTIIFNHVYKAEQMCFQDYCKFFNISVMNGYIPLNWIGLNADLPKELELFIFQLEERILFEEIWKTNCAFDLFSQHEHTYNEMVIIKRIYKHINHRINQICHNEHSDKDKINLPKFIEELLQNKIDLLRYNNLYIILIASIIHYKAATLDKIVQCLRRSEKYVRINLQFKGGLGNQISFKEYYQKFYLKEIQHLYSSSNSRQILSTPPKITPRTTVRFAATACKSPLIQKYNFGVDSLSGDKQDGYRKGLVDIILTGSPQKRSQSEDQGDDPEA